MRLGLISDLHADAGALERALERIGPDVPVDIHFQPFELNPTMGADGANAADYLKAKYGMGDEQLAANRANIAARPWGAVTWDGRAVGETPIADLPVRAGAHTLSVVGPDGRATVVTLTLDPGAAL
jgi:hypothetical protein